MLNPNLGNIPCSISQSDPVFLVGSPRSGTTFATRLINQFLDIHCARDKGLILRFYELLPHYNHLSDDSNRRRLVEDLFRDYFFKKRILQRGLNITPEKVLTDLRIFDYPTLIDYLFTQLARNRGKNRWANKYPSYALNIREICHLFPTAKFIHLIRDGRDVVLSMRHTSSTAVEKNWYHAGRDWRHHVLEARHAGQQLGPKRYVEIRYEDLMQIPTTVFATVVNFIGKQPQDQERLENFNRDIRTMLKPGNFFKWKRHMPPGAVEILEKVAGETLQALGYEIRNPHAVGRPFRSQELLWFSLENVQRKVFSRAFRKAKYFRYRLQNFLTKRRAIHLR